MKSDMVRKFMEKGYRVKVPTFYIWHMLCLVASLVFVHHQQPRWLNLKSKLPFYLSALDFSSPNTPSLSATKFYCILCITVSFISHS